MKDQEMYPKASGIIAQKKADLAPKHVEAWRTISNTGCQECGSDEKTKELVAGAVSHVTQRPYCSKAHTKRAVHQGASKEEIMDASWVAAGIRSGAAYAHANLARTVMDKEE